MTTAARLLAIEAVAMSLATQRIRESLAPPAASDNAN